MASIGLYFYRARYYDPALSCFTSADSIIPGAGDVQAWDRYAAIGNNPVRYIDPTGHMDAEPGDNGVLNLVLHHRRIFMGGIIAQPPKDVKADLPDSRVVNSRLLLVAGAASVAGDLVPLGIETEANVFTFLSYSEYLDGSVDDFGVSIDNQSNENVYLTRVDFEAEWFDNGFSNTPCCVRCGAYSARPTNSDYLATIRSDTSSEVNLYTNALNMSISPPHGLPPFSGRYSIDVTVYLLTSTLRGMSHTPLSTTINAPRGDWRVLRW